MKEFVYRVVEYRHIGWVIFAVALAVRLALLVLPSSDSPIPLGIITVYDSKTNPGTFTEEGMNVAKSLALHHAFADPFRIPTGPTAHLPPAFPWEMAIVFGLFGYGLMGNLVRCLIVCVEYSALIALLPAMSSRMRLPRTAGVLAGFAAAVYPFFFRIEVAVSRDEAIAGMFLLFLALATYHLAVSNEKPPLRAALLYGAAWGAMLYVHTGTVILIPAWLLIIVLWRGDPIQERLVFSLAVIATIGLVIAPWTIRNRVVMGAWMLMRDNAGLELSSSNGDLAKASYDEDSGPKHLIPDLPIFSEEVDRRIRREGEIQFNREKMLEGREWIRSHPDRFAKLTLSRIFYYWCDVPFAKIKFAGRTVLSLLGFCGVVLLWRRRLYAQAVIFSSVLLIFPVPYYFVRSMSRYTVPIYDFQLLAAGFFAYEMWRKLNREGQKGTYAVLRTIDPSLRTVELEHQG